jgi:excinuclease UvrABC helicase subunit UvrB
MGPELKRALISPARHFVMPREKIEASIGAIRDELDARVRELDNIRDFITNKSVRRFKFMSSYSKNGLSDSQ